MRNHCSRVVMICAVVLLGAGCSTKVLVKRLDQAIEDTRRGLAEAYCRNPKAFKGTVPAEFAVKTAYKAGVGVPIGGMPITVSGETQLEESTKVTVTIQMPDTCPVMDPASTELKAEIGSHPVYEYNRQTGVVQLLK